MSSYWINKPINVIDNNEDKLDFNEYVLDEVSLKTMIGKEIDDHKIKLDYKIQNYNQSFDNSELLDFINKNYVSLFNYFLYYTEELFNQWLQPCKNDYMIIKFYPKNNTQLVGLIIGKRIKLYIKGIELYTLEVNFLCLIPKLRNMNIAPLMINILTKECLVNFENVRTAFYSIHKRLQVPHFCNVNFYHIPINYALLTEMKLIDKLKEKMYFNNFLINKNKETDTIYLNSCSLDDDSIKNLYAKIYDYNKRNYDVYKIISLDEFANGFKNNKLHHFFIYNENSEIINYLCFFALDTIRYENSITQICKNGYYYYGFYKETSLEYIETSFIKVLDKIHRKKIFDMITVYNNQKLHNSNKIDIREGNGKLNYYLYNYKTCLVDTEKFGFITI